MEPVRLTAGSWVLRPHTRSDIDGVLDQCTDPETQAWTTVPSPYTRADAEQYVGTRVPLGWADGSYLAFAIADAETDEFLGTVDLHEGGHGPGAGEIGFGLRPGARGRGVMAAAVRAVLGWAFAPDGLGLELVYWRAQVGNWSSRRVAWATGFRVEGRVRGLCRQRGVRHDGWIASLHRDDPREPVHPWYDAVLLARDGIVLRPFRNDDADAVIEACTDPATRHWLAHLPRPYTKESALEFIRSRQEEHASGSGITWAAADAATDR
ncbi:MAG TPA: GNAT family N-acetyltransferase, partial [Actinopolymorphaceae bacterium]